MVIGLSILKIWRLYKYILGFFNKLYKLDKIWNISLAKDQWYIISLKTYFTQSFINKGTSLIFVAAWPEMDRLRSFQLGHCSPGFFEAEIRICNLSNKYDICCACLDLKTNLIYCFITNMPCSHLIYIQHVRDAFFSIWLFFCGALVNLFFFFIQA